LQKGDPQLKFLKKTITVRSCTVHVDSIKSFIRPTNAHKLL